MNASNARNCSASAAPPTKYRWTALNARSIRKDSGVGGSMYASAGLLINPARSIQITRKHGQ